jgi:hypothetical protein
VTAVSQKLHQTATAEPARTDAASATSGAAASGNAETEEAAARARLKLNLQWVPSAWIELGKDLFRDALTVEQVPDEAAFRAGAYKLIADLHHNVAPMLEVLACSPDRKPFLDALQAVDAAGKADAAHLRAIETDVKDLAAGGDVSYNTRELLAHYAPLSALGKGWLGGSPLVATTFATYVNGGECHRHGVLARSYSARGTLMEHAIVQAAQRDGDARVDAVRRLMMLLTKGTLGVGPITETPVVEDGAAKEAADAAQAADLAAIDAEVAKLEARIRAAVKSGKKHDGVRTVDDKTFKELKADLEAADPRVRDRIYADGELMNHLTQSADARQVQELVHAVDSVEALYQACLKIPPPPSPNPGIRVVHATKEPFQLVRDYLLERSAPEQKEARMRVLRHEQLKTAAIDPMTDDDRRLIFRLITRGTMEPTPEDRVHEAAKAGDGAAMARALMQLANEDPGQLAALKQDQLFWKSVEQLDKDIVVDGMTVNPFSLCLTMWGIEPRSSKDPGAEELHGTVNLTGDNRPLKIEERIKLDEELFGPTIRSLYSEFCETIVDDDDCVSIMRRFEEKALQKEYSDLLHRAKEAPGPTLEKKYDAVHSPLRNELSEYTEGNERRECERIVGVRLEATVGTIGGNVRLASDKDKGAMQLEQAVRETAHEGKPLTQWVSRCVDTFIEETYVPPEVNGISYGGGSAFGDLEEVLSAWNRWKDIFEQHRGALSALTGIAPGALHAIELLGNAFRMRSGELGARMNRCFGGKEREQVLTAMGLRAEDVGQRQMAGNTELMKTDPAAAIAQQADMLWKEPAQEIFEAIGTLSVGEDAEIDALATRLTAATAKGIEPPSDEAAAAKFATIAEDQQPRSFSAYYRKHNGIDYKLHIARVISASPGAWALGAIATKLGVDSSLIGPATAPPKDSLVVDETNQHLVRPDFTAARAEALGKQIWEVIHGSGEVHLIMSQLYGKYTPEEQRLISVAFQQLSGGIDVAFYIRQEMLVRKEGSDVTQVGGEGTEAGKAAVGGKTELNIEGDQTKLESALMVATTGELDNHARFKAAVANHDMNQLFRVCDDCSESECRKILGDSALMDAAYKACDQYAWDRVSKTLTGQSDLMDRLYSRAHGAYDSWNPFDCTDEAGIREDVKSYVQRLRRKFDKDLRASGKGTDPKKLQKDIEDKVRDACQRLMANPNVRGLIEDELSGSELAEVEGLILNGGEDSTKSDIAREGEEASTIIAGIRALKPEQKAPLRNDPEYLEKLAYRLTKPEDYREAMDLLMSDQSGQGGLADLDKAVNPHNDEDHDTRSAKKALLALSEAEYRQLAADPALQARILASIGNEKDRAMIREMISLRLPDVGKDLADADRQAAADASRLAYLKHSAVQRIQFATTLGWDTMLAQCVEVFQMDFAPAAVQAKPGADGEPPPDPSVQLAAAKAAGEKTRAEVWAAVEGDVASFSRKTVKDTRQTMSTISDAGAMTKLIRAAVMGVTDPSAERIKENLVGEKQITYGGETHTYRDASDNDQKGLLATLNAASPDLLIAEWTSVTQTRANGGESMQAVYQRFATTEDALSKKIEAAQQGEADQTSTKVESPLTAAERQAYQIEKLAFLNYVPGISDGFERMLLPYVGDENDATASGDDAQKREDLRTRDNKKYNELLDAIGSRAQGLPKAHTAKVATAIGASTPAHQKLIDNQNRESLGQLELREQKYLQQRGTQAGSGWAASDEAEALDQAMVRYSREAAMAQVTQDGQQDAYGMITAAEGAKIEEKGEEFDRAHTAFKDAKAKVAMWMSLIIGVLVTCILTVLTGGAATGFAAMLFWSAVTAGASAAAKAAINEAVLGSDYDFTDEGVKMIGKEMLTAVITAGTTFVAQKMVAGLSGATTLSRQARAAEQTMRVKPPLWKSFLNEGSEEILSETMSGTIEAGLIAIDPTHWMHGVVEGQDRALPEAWAKLSSVPGGALRGGITSIVTSGATRVLGAKKGQLQDLAHASRGKKINIRENFATVFGDQREAMIATFTEFAIAKIGGEKFDIENVPGELLQGYLQEMNEKSVEMHTGTAHKGKRGDRAQADVKKYEHLLTKQEQTDFLKMNDGAEATDTYITPADYVGVRHRMATDALGAWGERTGQQLTPDQAQGFIMFVRGAKDADELQLRLQTDPRTAAGVGPIEPHAAIVPDAQAPATAEAEQSMAPPAEVPTSERAREQDSTSQQSGHAHAGATAGAMPAPAPNSIVAVVESPEAGHALLHRLVAGDASVLAELSISLPGGKATNRYEWALGAHPDGTFVLIYGAEDAVTWSGALEGLVPLAHSHPIHAGNQLRNVPPDGLAIADILRKMDLESVHLFPSAADIAVMGRSNVAGHVVHTPFVHIGDGRVGNPGPGVSGPTVDFLIQKVDYLGRWDLSQDKPVFKARLVAMAGGVEVWSGDAYAIEGTPFQMWASQPPVSATAQGIPDPDFALPNSTADRTWAPDGADRRVGVAPGASTAAPHATRSGERPVNPEIPTARADAVTGEFPAVEMTEDNAPPIDAVPASVVEPALVAGVSDAVTDTNATSARDQYLARRAEMDARWGGNSNLERALARHRGEYVEPALPDTTNTEAQQPEPVVEAPPALRRARQPGAPISEEEIYDQRRAWTDDKWKDDPLLARALARSRGTYVEPPIAAPEDGTAIARELGAPKPVTQRAEPESAPVVEATPAAVDTVAPPAVEAALVLAPESTAVEETAVSPRRRQPGAPLSEEEIHAQRRAWTDDKWKNDPLLARALARSRGTYVEPPIAAPEDGTPIARELGAPKPGTRQTAPEAAPVVVDAAPRPIVETTTVAPPEADGAVPTRRQRKPDEMPDERDVYEANRAAHDERWRNDPVFAQAVARVRAVRAEAAPTPVVDTAATEVPTPVLEPAATSTPAPAPVVEAPPAAVETAPPVTEPVLLPEAIAAVEAVAETASPAPAAPPRTISTTKEGLESLNSEGAFDYRLERVGRLRQDILTGSETEISPDVSPDMIALMRDHIHVLTDEQMAAIQGYTSQDYQAINRVMRTPESDPTRTARLEGYIAAITAGLAALPTYEGEVYRGTGMSQAVWAEWEAAHRENRTVSDAAFASSSQSEEVAEDFLEKGRGAGKVPVFCKIQSRTGRHVEFLSKTANEVEVLFAGGTKFRIVYIADTIGPDGLPRKEVMLREVAEEADDAVGDTERTDAVGDTMAMAGPEASSRPAVAATNPFADTNSVALFAVGQVPEQGKARWDFLADPSNWTAERAALHDELLTQALADAQAFADAAQQGDPTIYAMRGNTAAGKSRAIRGNISALEGPMNATAGRTHRAVNPDNFKQDLIRRTTGGTLTTQQVHEESSALATRLENALLERRTSDGTEIASMLIDKRLAYSEDVAGYATMAKATGRKLNVYDVDASLEVSLAGVLERQPGGADPLPPFGVVASGFTAVRSNRQAVIDQFVADPTLGDYELFGTLADGSKVKVATVTNGVLEVFDEAMFAEVLMDPRSAAEQIGNTEITQDAIERMVAALAPDRAAAVRAVLLPYMGRTWKEALDAHAKSRG